MSISCIPKALPLKLFCCRIASCYPRDEETSKEGKHGTDGDTAEANVQERFAV